MCSSDLDGEAALDLLNEREFDLVLMDVNMPVMNGIEATKLYRFASLGRPRVPIVALTADATEEIARRCEEAGMDACVTKPVEPHRLIEVIATLVQDAGKNLQFSANASEAAGHISAAAAAVDSYTLNALERLGGKEFVDELVAQFLDDAADMLRTLAAVVASGDVQAFREQLHALRSAAANIGARAIYEMCLDWRQIASEELASQGEMRLNRLREEFERVHVALQGRLSERDAAA